MVIDIRYKKGFLYYIYCIKTKKKYVGSSIKTEEERWKNHKKDCNKKKNDGTYYSNSTLYKHMREFGIKNFKLIKIEDWSCDNLKQLEMRETYWQVIHNTVNNGLNDNYARELPIYEKELEKIIQSKNKNNLFIPNNTKYRNQFSKRTIEKQKQYKEKNKIKINEYYRSDKRKEQKRIDYNKNKEKINEKRKNEKIKCDCGSEIRKVDISIHKKTQKHLKYLESQK